VTAVCVLVAEWSRPDRDYGARMADLLGPAAGGTAGGLNGSYYLNPTTVYDDRASNVLAGLNGMDWFFASAAGQDFLTKKRRSDVVTAIS
jgi:hypothetical protein